MSDAQSKPVVPRLDEPGSIPALAGEHADLLKALHPSRREQRYIALRAKLFLVVSIALAWASFSLWLSIPWIDALGSSITMPGAMAVIFGIAIIPGYLNANLIASLLIDRPPPLRFDLDFPVAHRRHRLLQRGGDDRGDARLRRQAGVSGRAADPGC